jgi:hypothetical protein
MINIIIVCVYYKFLIESVTYDVLNIRDIVLQGELYLKS